MSIGTELDLCYLETTHQIQEAVQHILDGEGCGVQLKEDLLEWQHGVSERTEKRQETAEYFLGKSVIPFDLVVRIHDQLKINPLG